MWKSGLLLILVAFVPWFFTLDRKVFWSEEIYALEAIVGAESPQDYERKVAEIQPVDARHTFGEILKVSGIGPENTTSKTVSYLFHHDRHHLPFYYSVAHLWARAFGDSKFSLRLISLICGVLASLGTYFFLREAWDEKTALWAGLLIATSPLVAFYSQFVREYSLWLCSIAWTFWAFTRYLKKPTLGTGLVSVLLATVTMYSFLFTVLLIPSWILGAWAYNRFQWNRKLIWNWAPIAVSFLLFLPFGLAIFFHAGAIQDANVWAYGHHLGFFGYFGRLLAELSHTGLDFPVTRSFWTVESIIGAALLIGVVGGVTHQWKASAHHRPWITMLAAAILVPMTVLGSLDLARAGITLLTPRYLLGSYLAFMIFLAVALQSWTRSYSRSVQWIFGLWILIAFVSSLYNSLGSYTPYMKHPEVVAAIHQLRTESGSYRLILDRKRGGIRWITLARQLPLDTEAILLNGSEGLNQLAESNSPTYFFHPSKPLLEAAREKWQTRMVEYVKGELWLLKKAEPVGTAERNSPRSITGARIAAGNVVGTQKSAKTASSTIVLTTTSVANPKRIGW